MFDPFARLSLALSGLASLDPAATARHLATLQAAPEGAGLAAALQHFEGLLAEGRDPDAAVSAILAGDAAEAAAVKAATLLWFIGRTSPAAAQGVEEDYFGALMWEAVGAHPPGASDAYYGHWRFPPDVGV